MRLISVAPATRRLEIADLDMLEGTPVLDIKPYVPWTDAIPSSKTGWLESDGVLPGGERPADPRPSWPVELSPLARTQLDWLLTRGVDLAPRVTAALALGPQPHAYRRIKKQRDGTARLAVKEWYAHFRVLPASIVVESIEPGVRPQERSRAPFQDEFEAVFPRS